jgi:hypothetical protein
VPLKICQSSASSRNIILARLAGFFATERIRREQLGSFIVVMERPLYLRKRTSLSGIVMSPLCHKRTSLNLFDHLFGAGDQ